MSAIREIRVKEIMESSGIPEVDYEINPYVGCVYNCLYCYARYVQDDSGHTEPWGCFIDAKINAPELIEDNSDKYVGKEVFIGSKTDPYLPCELEYRLTRGILDKLVHLSPNLSLQTKSDLVLRDIDLLKKFEVCEVGMTITTLDDSLRSEIEDAASTVEQRINALRKLKQEGISTYAFVGPLLPGLTDWKAIIDSTAGFIDYYAFELLNIEGEIWDAVLGWLKEKHPELCDEYEQIYFSDTIFIKQINKFFWRNFGYSLTGFNSYRNHLYNDIRSYAKHKNIEVVFNDLL
jgi:DNA repair photolyase